MNLDTLFSQQNALPTIPKVVQEVIDSFNNDSVSIDEIASKLTADLVISAKLLRLSNSTYYHSARNIGTVDDAILMLGFTAVRTLVISSGLAGGFKTLPGIDLKLFWRYSMHTAVISKWLAQQLKVNSDFAFTVGLMHAIGQLVMHAAMPDKMVLINQIVEPLGERRLAIEQSSFGFNYSDVGSELAKRWHFPEKFSTVIKGFPDPLGSGNFDPMEALINLAAWRARVEENNFSKDELHAQFPEEIALKLNISKKQFLEEMPPIVEMAAGLEDLVS